MSSPRRLAVALLVVATVAACDTDDGRTLRPPPPGVTAPPLPTSTTSTTAGAVIGPPVGSEAVAALVLESSAFGQGAAIPTPYTCDADGGGVSPPLNWSAIPAGTVELALTVRDPDAPSGDFVHLVVAGIDPSVLGVGEGGLPETAVVVQPWIGPCPPTGETHHYVFTLFALNTPSGVDAGGDTAAAIAALEAAGGARAMLTGTYRRPSA
jgi:Raf kinase inhibitor-like YbhB/YbcL family protein